MPRIVTGIENRSQRDAARQTYKSAIPATINNLILHITPEVSAQADDARAAIARFDAELSEVIPGTEFAPLQSVLLRTESSSSSQIENITAGARSLALAELGIVKYGSNAALVTANVDAMSRALDLANDVTPDTILAIHEALMRGQNHASPGAYRDEQVWIGGSALSPHSAAFVPPHQTRVFAAIKDLCAFTRRTNIPLLPQAAIAHAQFETIHPFNDGNGRTGRALVHAILKNGGATTRSTVPVSAGLLRDTNSYFDSLTAYREGDPNPIITQFSQAAFSAIANGRQLAAEMRALQQRWATILEARRGAAAWSVLPRLLSQPAITSTIVQQQLGVSQPAADNALRQLADAGIVQKASGVQRYVVWIAGDVVTALDAFADRARRR